MEKEIKNIISEKMTLGSKNIRTGLCIVTKRADTFSTWPFINHPKGKFFSDNSDIPLWKILRASSAAPTFFTPIELDIGTLDEPDYGMFVDGGISMSNNPAFQLYLIATLQGFPYQWLTGAENLMLVSVGTGFWKKTVSPQKLQNPLNTFWAQQVPEMLMHDANEKIEILMQCMSNSYTNRYINYEIGNLSNDMLTNKPSVTYLRYNVELETQNDYQLYHPRKNPNITSLLSSFTEKDIKRLREMDRGSNTQELLKIGETFASEEVKSMHFPQKFAIF